MKPRVLAGMILLAAAMALTSGSAHAQAPDSLVLQQPENFRVWSVYSEGKHSFVVWMTWDEPPDSVSTYVHPPDTSGWSVVTPDSLLSLPTTRGPYTGDTDRTIFFRSRAQGQVGQADPLEIVFEVRREENLNGIVDVGSGYVPGTWLPVIFDDEDTPTIDDQIDFGFQVAFSPGAVDLQASFIVGLEDFEGYHLWRGIEPDGSDLTVIGEISKEEANIGNMTGGSFADSVYFYIVLPQLRQFGVWFSPFGSVDCLGSRIDLSLQDEEAFWWDCNAFNGFTYYYAVTTFDRGYGVTSGRQGLQKFDNCEVVQDSVDSSGRQVKVPFECADQLQSVKMEVEPQNDPRNIYVVPNPYRTGGSKLTTDNYHNFPDDVVRFVNVPGGSMIKVYTMAGDLVWEYEHPGPKGNVEWDTTNRGGVLITSGVYIYRVEMATGSSMYGRFVVIR